MRISHEPLTSEERAVAQETFLNTYATRGNATAGCGAAGVGRTSINRWLERDEAFSTRYEQAKAKYCDRLRQEIDRRAVNGVLKPVYYQGEKVGTIREYSDTLLIFQAKAKMPEYREKVQVEQTGVWDMQTLVALRQLIAQTFPNDPEALKRLADAMAKEKAGDQDT